MPKDNSLLPNHSHQTFIREAIDDELTHQRKTLKLIASENYSSLAVQQAMGNLLTDKYAEGIPGYRFYSGCENIDRIENLTISLAKQLFGAEHAYVQPHSGADANIIALWSILLKRVQKPFLQNLGKTLDTLNSSERNQLREAMLNCTLMGMSLPSGGHLTHGYHHHISSLLYRAVSYEVDRDSEVLDYSSLAKQVDKCKPDVLIAGGSSYPRRLDFAQLRKIADSVGAVLLTDMAHFSGLVAGGVLSGRENPIPYSDISTTTTHKVLRGPRGGLILCKENYKPHVDKGCPGVIGGPLPHIIAAKGIAFSEALHPSYRHYAHQVVSNAQTLAKALQSFGIRLVSGGTDTHIVLIDVWKTFSITGKEGETTLAKVGILANRNAIPFDQHPPWHSSGLRLGTAALTTRGMGEEEMISIASWIYTILKKPTERDLKVVSKGIEELLERFPLYPELANDQINR